MTDEVSPNASRPLWRHGAGPVMRNASLCIGAILLVALSLWLVDYFHLKTMGDAPSQYASLLLLALSCCLLLSRIVPTFYSIEIGICAVIFTLMWGRVIFCGYLYHDEVGRAFSLPPIGRILVTPVNDHLMPWMWLEWIAQYKVFHGQYWLIALSHYSFGLLGTCVAAKIICLSATDGAANRIVGAMFAALSTLSQQAWISKGCGDSLVIAWSLFLLLLYLCLTVRQNSSRLRFWPLVMLYILVLGSSSLITLGFVYLCPLLVIKEYRCRKFLMLLAVCVLLSAGYWLLRSHLISETRPHPISRIPGALRVVWYTYSGRSWGVVTVLALIGAGGLFFALRRRLWTAMAVLLAGVGMYGLGTMQLWGARDLDWHPDTILTGYHMFLPYFGISLVIGTSLAIIPITRYLSYVIGVLLVSFYCDQAIPINQRTVEYNQSVMRARKEFFTDLRHLMELGLDIPNKSLAYTPDVKRFDWCPVELLTDPAQAKKWRWPTFFTVEKLSYFTGRTARLLPADTPYGTLPPVTRTFMEKYWPNDR